MYNAFFLQIPAPNLEVQITYAEVHIYAHVQQILHYHVTRETATSACTIPGTNDIKDERYLRSLSSSTPQQGIFVYYCGLCTISRINGDIGEENLRKKLRVS